DADQEGTESPLAKRETQSPATGESHCRTLNSIEPPWYGPVCPVVWEGRSREAPPYPDLRDHRRRRRATVASQAITTDRGFFSGCSRKAHSASGRPFGHLRPASGGQTIRRGYPKNSQTTAGSSSSSVFESVKVETAPSIAGSA